MSRPTSFCKNIQLSKYVVYTPLFIGVCGGVGIPFCYYLFIDEIYDLNK